MEIAIISIVAAVLLAMYVVKSRDYKQQERDNRWLDGQHENMQAPVAVDDVDSHQLDKETAMEAIRYNGYVPDADNRWIIFTVRGEQYAIDSGRFPVMVLMRHYSLDHNDWDMDLMHKAAHQVSDELIMCKVLFCGEDEDGIVFQLSAIEDKYGHFKDCLTRYISIIEESYARMSEIYNEMCAKRKEGRSLSPQLGTGASGEKKVMS
uniref:hypothetical protein n=1 Tax=Candidatus Cryptobacteroides bacterium TaxID=3085639 RepID=UPI004025138A